jgi:outer membrane protein assembly factor BamB
VTAALRKVVAASAIAALLGGCGIFGDEEDEALQPKPLVEIEATLPVERAWNANLGGGSEFLRIALAPAGSPERVFAASRDGRVSAFQPQSGERIWETELEVPLSAGPGAGQDRVAVSGSNGFLYCLRADNGSEVWRTYIGGESLASPLIAEDSVIVYTIDGTLGVYSVFNGSERWTLEQNLPPLTLRGTSEPIVVGTTVIAGFDNGRVVASSLIGGETSWEVVLSPPTGRSDLERLSDVDGAMAVVGQDLYATGYQGRMAALAAESGQILWSREISTHVGLGADEDNVYVVAETGELIALDRQTGSERWRQDALLRRSPTAPVPFEGAVAVGDFEGFVHFFSREDGSAVARVRVGDRMLSSAPVVIGDQLYVQSEAGRLGVFEVRRPEQAAETGEGS